MTAPAEPTLSDVLAAVEALPVSQLLAAVEALAVDQLLPSAVPGWPFRLLYSGWPSGFEVSIDCGPQRVWQHRYRWADPAGQP